jgi:hypothetical protein
VLWSRRSRTGEPCATFAADPEVPVLDVCVRAPIIDPVILPRRARIASLLMGYVCLPSPLYDSPSGVINCSLQDCTNSFHYKCGRGLLLFTLITLINVITLVTLTPSALITSTHGIFYIEKPNNPITYPNSNTHAPGMAATTPATTRLCYAY